MKPKQKIWNTLRVCERCGSDYDSHSEVFWFWENHDAGEVVSTADKTPRRICLINGELNLNLHYVGM